MIEYLYVGGKAMEALKLKEVYTVEDIIALPEDVRAELLDGEIYYMAAPSTVHQRILTELLVTIRNYLKDKGGHCEVFPAPFAVFLNDDRDYLEPDIIVICDPKKIKKDGCHGAPDWVIEIVSPSSASRDYLRKQYAYSKAGVREYWVIDPQNEGITVNNFSDGIYEPTQYKFTDQIKVGIYEDLIIDFSEIALESAE
jgi:Uma2 family endonuclease